MAGDHPRAEGELKKGCEALRAMGERGFLSSLARLAEAVYEQGRLFEAQRLTEEAQALAAAEDLYVSACGGPRKRSCSPAAASSPLPDSWLMRHKPSFPRLPGRRPGQDTSGQSGGKPARRST